MLLYRIGMFSKISKTTIKTLRHYDEVGLLAPAHTDKENGYRYYTTQQLFQLHEIIGLRQMGFSIPEVSAIMAGRDSGSCDKKVGRGGKPCGSAAKSLLLQAFCFFCPHSVFPSIKKTVAFSLTLLYN